MDLIYKQEVSNCFKSSLFLPRELAQKEKLQIYHKYWVPYFNQVFKLNYIDTYHNITYYFLENKEGTQVYTYPITDEFYEFMIDRNNLNTVNLINSDKPYYGYEIRNWFYRHRMESKYQYYARFVCYKSKHCINDNKLYKISGTLEHDVYKDCKIVSIRK